MKVEWRSISCGMANSLALSSGTPKRSDREQYLVAKASYLETKDPSLKPKTENYWVKIPSNHMYFFADKIYNMNLTYVTDAGGALDPTEVLKRYIGSELGLSIKAGSDLSVSLDLTKKDHQPDAGNTAKP